MNIGRKIIDNDKTKLKVIVITIACSEHMADKFHHLRTGIIEQLDGILTYDDQLSKDVIFAINVHNGEEKVLSYPNIEIINREIWQAWTKEFDMEKLQKYPSF